jgi:hypothetical protein
MEELVQWGTENTQYGKDHDIPSGYRAGSDHHQPSRLSAQNFLMSAAHEQCTWSQSKAFWVGRARRAKVAAQEIHMGKTLGGCEFDPILGKALFFVLCYGTGNALSWVWPGPEWSLEQRIQLGWIWPVSVQKETMAHSRGSGAECLFWEGAESGLGWKG